MRITVRLSDELGQRLAEATQGRGVDVSTLVREACTAFLNRQTSGPPIPSAREPARTTDQPPDDGSQGILQMRSPEGHAALRQSSRDMLWEEQMAWGPTRAMTPPPPMVPPHQPDDCARVVIERCAPKARQRLEEACARRVNPLLAVTGALEVWDYLRQFR